MLITGRNFRRIIFIKFLKIIFERHAKIVCTYLDRKIILGVIYSEYVSFTSR